jgi:glutathione peroxidase
MKLMTLKNISRIFRRTCLVVLILLDILLITTTVNATTMTNSIKKSPINENGCPATLDFKLKSIASTDSINLCEAYKGKVVLIVNTASKCGFTDQFGELETLYDNYKDKGFVVLGFPSNDFGNQDPENEKKIASFCRLTYGVKFPMFEKTHAAQQGASPIYQTLGNLAGEFPRWNFHKYLLDKEGNMIASFPSQIGPANKDLVEMIKSHL